MTLLPIVERELRVASRRRGTFWTRLLAALGATLIAGAILLLSRQSGGLGISPGFILFQALGWLGFLFAIAAGVFLTSDCLSEERREGTLGLLFLTHLRGYDVVLGKLAATSLWAAYGLLGVAPVFALAFLLGGVTGGQFWRLGLALGSTLLFSLSAGMAVSAHSRDSQKAMTGTLLVCLLFAGGLPLLDQGLKVAFPAPIMRFGMFSPYEAFSTAARGGAGYWWSLLAVIGMSSAFLGLGSLRVRRRIDEIPAGSGQAGLARETRSRRRSAAQDAATRRQLLDVNPILWLAGRHAGTGRAAAILVGVGLVGLAVVSVIAWGFGTADTGVFTVSFGIMGALHGLLWLLLLLWITSQACRFLLEGRRSGFLEQLLVTPVSVPEILGGHWRALWRTFRFPVLAMLGLNIVSALVQPGQFQVSGRASPGFDPFSFQMVSLALGLVNSVTGLLALISFGTWMGLMSQKVPHAVIKTVVFVGLIPSITLSVAQAFGAMALTFTFSQWSIWLSVLLHSLISAGVDIGFILAARSLLLNRFRDIVTGDNQAGRMFRRSSVMSSKPPSLAVAGPASSESPSPISDLDPPPA